MRVDGYFNTNDQPAMKLDLITSSIEVLIDTGFAGSLIIPEHLSTGLELHFEGFEEFYTATGACLCRARLLAGSELVSASALKFRWLLVLTSKKLSWEARC